MSTSPDAHPESYDHTAGSGQLEVSPADATATAEAADLSTVRAPEAAERDDTLTTADQPVARHEADTDVVADEADLARPALEPETTQQLGRHALVQPEDAAVQADDGADDEVGGEAQADGASAEHVEADEDLTQEPDGDAVADQAADVPRPGLTDCKRIDPEAHGRDDEVVPAAVGDAPLDVPPAAAELEGEQADEADDLADEPAEADHAAGGLHGEDAEAAAPSDDGGAGEGNGPGGIEGGVEGGDEDELGDDESDDVADTSTTNPEGRGNDLEASDADAIEDADTDTGEADDVDYDLGDYIDNQGKGNADPAQVERERVLTELQDRIDHANRMADHIQAAQDLGALGGYVDPYLADAAREASEAVQAYLDRYPDEFADVAATSSVEDDVTRWTFDVPDTDVVPPLHGDMDTDLGDGGPEGSAIGDDPDLGSAETWDPLSFRPEDDTTIHVGDVDSSVPMPDDLKGVPKTDYEEVKTLGGAIMEKVWGRLSQLHERVVTKSDDRTIERLRILDKALKVDLYKITHGEDDFQRSAYYLATGRTGFRGGIQRGFREQQPVALRRAHGSDVRASNIIARQTRRQDVIHNTRGSAGLRTFAQVVKSTYDAKRDAHQSKLIYKHERTNARYDLTRERQALHARMIESRHDRGPRGDRTREAIRAEFRELRDRERDLRQHHRNVRRQGLGHRAVRTGGRLTGRAAVGSAKLGYKAAKGGARQGYKAATNVARRTNDRIGDLAAKRAAERTGTPVSPRPAGTPRPPRDPSTPRTPAAPRTPGARRGAGGGRRAGPLGRRGAGRPAAGSRPTRGADDSDR
jgi:hypothetical protein